MADISAKENVDPNSKTSITSSTDGGGQKGNSAPATTTTFLGPKLPAIHISTSSPYVGSSPRKHTFAKGNQASRIRNATTTFLHPRRRSPRPTPDDSQQRERTANNMQYQTDEYLDTCALPHMSAMFSSQMPMTPLTASIPGVNFRDDVISGDRHEAEEQRQLITHLAQSNAKLFGYIELLEHRIRSLEAKDTYDRGPLITPLIKLLGSTHSFGTVAEPELGLDATGSELDSDLHIASASIQAPSPPTTPSKSKAKAKDKKATSSFTISTPKKKGNTMLNKRKTHNLTSTLAPIFTQIPAVPLTDKELVVYLFNSLSRPIVAIRLYERGWGPARICDTLNSHRAIDPPYLRNTCSVKCITAIRRGLEKWGNEWDAQLRDLLRDADDATATDALRIQDDESDQVFDVDVLQLLNGLVKHADDEDEDSAGIFTQCVKYCAGREISWPLSKLHHVALALQEGREPDLKEAHD